MTSASKQARAVSKGAVTVQIGQPPKTRLSPADRERQIIDGAIAYFSEVGFSGQTRELSKRLGITQPLLYRYFSNKQALIDRVYQTVFEGRWKQQWVELLEDRSVPFRDRLIEFYRQYSEATYRPDWIRINMHAGLSMPTLNQRYIKRVRRELMPVYCRELRHFCGIRKKAKARAQADGSCVPPALPSARPSQRTSCAAIASLLSSARWSVP